MNACGVDPVGSATTAEEARTRVGTALALLELAAQVLEDVPAPETAFPRGDRELYRYLQAAASARIWLVGRDAGDGVEQPAPGSALGAGTKTYGWDPEETERNFLAAIRDWSERQ